VAEMEAEVSVVSLTFQKVVLMEVTAVAVVM
jgi:hypothetical protein